MNRQIIWLPVSKPYSQEIRDGLLAERQFLTVNDIYLICYVNVLNIFIA